MSRKSFYLGIFAVFVSGIILGVVSTHLFMMIRMAHGPGRGPKPDRDFFMSRLVADLNLSREQVEKAEPIVIELQQGIEGVKKEEQPRIERLIDEAVEKGNSILNEKQREKLREMRLRLTDHWRMGREGPPPDGPPRPPRF